MKKMLLFLVMLCFGSTTWAALGPKITVINATNCVLYFRSYADDYGSCGSTNYTQWTQVQPSATVFYYGATAPWVSPQINGINWTSFMVAGDPTCSLMGGGSPCTNDYTTVYMPCTSGSPSSCFRITNNCSVCAPGTKVNVLLTSPNGYDVEIHLMP